MTVFFPGTGTEAEWNEAYYRLEDYLRAHWIINKVHQSQLILSILERAARRHAGNPAINPTTLAMEEALREIDLWFGQLLCKPDLPPERVTAMGRVAMFVTDAPVRWPRAFLAADPGGDFVEAMRRTTLQAGPDLEVSSMVPRTDDAEDSGNLLQEAWEKLSRSATILIVSAGGAVSIALFFLFRH